MPEGHVTHRAARLHTKRFGKKSVNVSSPQGRFSDSAQKVDGSVVEKIEARGKHIFYWFSTGEAVHIHLGLFGKFRLSKSPFPEPSENARVLIWTDDHEMQLTGPNTCELLVPTEIEKVLSKLGPDPIAEGMNGLERFQTAVSKRKIPVGRALMDQKVAAGLGNVFRSELLFLTGINPHTASNELPEDQVDQLWRTIVDALKSAERSGKIVTITPEDAGDTPRSKLERNESLYTYHRDGRGCRRCGTLIQMNKIDSRNIWWCPNCQPAR